jgi:hypothetical protein
LNLITKPFGTTPDGAEITLFTLSNDQNLAVSIINFGGAITSIKVPDRNGNTGDVVLGYDTLDEYVRNPRFFWGPDWTSRKSDRPWEVFLEWRRASARTKQWRQPSSRRKQRLRQNSVVGGRKNALVILLACT